MPTRCGIFFADGFLGLIIVLQMANSSPRAGYSGACYNPLLKMGQLNPIALRYKLIATLFNGPKK